MTQNIKLSGGKIVFILMAIIILAAGTLLIFSIWKKNKANQSKTSPSASISKIAANNSASQVQHVLIVMGENQDYSKIIGNTAQMPYLNQLANTYAYAKEYYGNVHPSMGNYFMLTGGKIFSAKDSFTGVVSEDNIVRQLIAAGKIWKEYSENLPSVGYTGADASGYTQHHNPLSFYSDVRENNNQLQNLVPFSQFAKDLNNNQLPDYSFIVPSNSDNAHSCTSVSCFDNWLKANIDPLVKKSDFNTPGKYLLIITFDESAMSDKTRGGGHTVWVAAGGDIKRGYAGSTVYQEENTLRFTCDLLGLGNCPGKAASAANMNEFLIGN